MVLNFLLLLSITAFSQSIENRQRQEKTYMETLIRAIEIFAFITGIIYIVLEILQKKSMWLIGIVTGLACAFSFGVQHIYASAGLNIYYVFVSIWGIYQWRKAEKKLGGRKQGEDEGLLHLKRMDALTLIVSGAVLLLGSISLIFFLRLLGGSESVVDAVVTVMSAIGTFWLAKSYLQQWFVWIAADILSAILCYVSGMYWMALLYIIYTASAAYGYFHWKKKGIYI